MTRPLSYKPVKARLLGKNSSDQRERVLAVVRQHRLLGGPAAVSISALILAGLLAVVLGPAAATLGGESSPAEPASSSPAAAAEAQKSATVDEGAETKGWMGKVDREFGDKLVKPLTKVLFFDLWSSRWLRCVVPTEATCPECKSKFVVADTWPGESIPIVLTCPECGADIPTGNSVPLVVLWLFVGALFFKHKVPLRRRRAPGWRLIDE